MTSSSMGMPSLVQRTLGGGRASARQLRLTLELRGITVLYCTVLCTVLYLELRGWATTAAIPDTSVQTGAWGAASSLQHTT